MLPLLRTWISSNSESCSKITEHVVISHREVVQRYCGEKRMWVFLWRDLCGQPYRSRTEGRRAVSVLLCTVLGQLHNLVCHSPVCSISHSKNKVTFFSLVYIWVAQGYKLPQIRTCLFSSGGETSDTWCFISSSCKCWQCCNGSLLGIQWENSIAVLKVTPGIDD